MQKTLFTMIQEDLFQMRQELEKLQDLLKQQREQKRWDELREERIDPTDLECWVDDSCS